MLIAHRCVIKSWSYPVAEPSLWTCLLHIVMHNEYGHAFTPVYAGHAREPDDAGYGDHHGRQRSAGALWSTVSLSFLTSSLMYRIALLFFIALALFSMACV